MAERVPRITVFACTNSGYQAAQAAGPVPAEIKLIEVPCSGKVENIHLMKAIEEGADGVLVLACIKESCQYLRGNLRAEKRVEYVRQILKEIGVEPEIVRYCNLAPNMNVRFAELVAEMVEDLKRIGSGSGAVAE